MEDEPINAGPANEPTEPIDNNAEPQEPIEPQEPATPFTDDQVQYIGSWMGRMVKKQIEETVLPEIRSTIPQQQQFQPASPDGKNPLEKFNEELQNQIFSGDVFGAFQKIQQINNAMQSNQMKQKKTMLKKAITEYSDKPMYKDVYADMVKIAEEKVAAGADPQSAADSAYDKAVANKALNVDNSVQPTQMASSNKRQPPVQRAKLPDAFQKAAARDISKGLFKDEQDYIDNLSPHIRQQYGI